MNEDSFIPRNKTDYDDADVIPEFEEAFIKAQQSCSGGTCSLPPTQHLQMRVIQICITNIVNLYLFPLCTHCNSSTFPNPTCILNRLVMTIST